MRRPFISANWKMHKTVSEALGFLDDFLPRVKDVSDVDIVIAPVFTALHAVAEKIKGTNVILSAQNTFYEEKGAYTGEISPLMLKDIGCEHTIIGHSERRQYFGETDETVNKRIKAALGAGLKVIFCIGETLKEREAGNTNDVLDEQLTGGLEDISLNDIVIAYEPVWAIGTGVTATPEQAQEAHKFIRGKLVDMYDAESAEKTRILYGGSVKPENVKELMDCPDIDGALVGGASLKPDSFENLVKFKEAS
jgi:triosephosphate isomerase